MKKKRIAIIGIKGLPSFGGGARSTESLINELKDEYDITVYSINSHTKLSGDYNGINQITFKSLPFKRANTLTYYFKSLFHCLFAAKYDLIHVQHIYAGFIIPFLRIRYRVINTVRGIIPKDDNKWNAADKIFFRSFEYLALKFSNISVSVCQPHIPYLNKIVSKKIEYIPNGVHIFQSILDNKKEQDYISFSAGRIISLKGCHLLLEALHKIGYKGKIKIVGSLEHVKSYAQVIEDLAQGLDVEFLGLIKDKEELFKVITDSKLFVFPSLNEGMSNMLLEAASLKTPIIASDIIENKYVFTEEEVTFFESNNSDDLAEKISKALENKELLAAKAEKAFEKVSTDHDWKKIASTYRALYERLIK